MLTSEPLGSAVHRNSKEAAVTPYEPRACIPIGARGPEGRCAATRMGPPCFPPVLAPAEAAALPPALAPALAAPPLAAGDAGVPLHAAMTMPIAPVERPRMVARWMNSRR